MLYIPGQKHWDQKKREIPINDDLAQMFKEIRKEQGLTSQYIFTYSMRMISLIDWAFKWALSRAGIENFLISRP